MLLNRANVVNHLERSRFRFSRLVFNVVHCADNKCQAAEDLSRLQPSALDTKPIENDLPIAIATTDTSDSTKVCFENHQQALAQLVEHNEILNKGAAPVIEEFIPSLNQTLL